MGVKVNLISLGCSKNLVDSEWMQGILNSRGYEIVGIDEKAEVTIINTCAFITPAKEEAIETIFDTVRRKISGKTRAIVVAGCLAQRYGSVLLEEIPEIDGVMGTGAIPRISQVLTEILQGKRPCQVGSPAFSYQQELPRQLTLPSYSAYLKIADGCNNCCSYCAIPSIRGSYQSRPLDLLVREAYQLAEKGVRELVIVAQDTTAYGQDLPNQPSLAELLKRLAEIKFPWIRLMYAYPQTFSPELIEVMASHSNICRYLDLPLQHINDSILKAMNRHTSRREIESLLASLRQNLPGLALRTTFMVGFPGETPEQFQELLDFMAAERFEKAGVFAFSPEEGTKAWQMSGQIPEEIRQERYEQAMLWQQQISLNRNAERLGQKVQVLVEEANGYEYWGRTEFDSPEVDGVISFKALENDLQPGDLVEVTVTGYDEYDLWGVKA